MGLLVQGMCGCWPRVQGTGCGWLLAQGTGYTCGWLRAQGVGLMHSLLAQLVFLYVSAGPACVSVCACWPSLCFCMCLLWCVCVCVPVCTWLLLTHDYEPRPGVLPARLPATACLPATALLSGVLAIKYPC